MTTKPFKPSIAFLRKVEAREVYNAVSYSSRRGGQYKTRGGEKAIQAHAEAGFIKAPYIADLGRRSYAELTDAGREALASGIAAAPAGETEGQMPETFPPIPSPASERSDTRRES